MDSTRSGVDATSSADALLHMWSFVGSSVDTVALIGIFFTLVIFYFQQRRAARVEKQQNYLKLELASIELFRFEAENASLVETYDALVAPDPYLADAVTEREASTFYFMTLNLFEISIRMRYDYTIDPDVFGSWVAWYYDTLTSWYFRREWPEFRRNYTPQLRAVFDPFAETFDPNENDDARRKRFFKHVGELLNCPIVKKWLEDDLART
ncbi:MAG: hypothetical protein AAF719_01115 [Pseudomonadota bacterium]